MPPRSDTEGSDTRSTAEVHLPELLQIRNPSDLARLNELQRTVPPEWITDTIRPQLEEYVKLRRPDRKATAAEISADVAELLGGQDLRSYGTWVYYPWSRRLVHLLPEAEFAAVRTNRNRNKITEAEQQRLSRSKVGVIGLSVGQSVSLTMALERSFGEIRLADFDSLDLSNLNRLRSGVHNLGVNKAVMTAREIAELDPYLKVTCFTSGLTKENMDAFFLDGGRLDVVVEECDSVDIKILARQKAKSLGIPVVMDMSDRGCLDIERFDLEPDRPLMHGWIDHLDLDAAARPMSAEEKVPYMLPITGVETLSPRMKASVIELGRSVSTWPQLATSVVLGGALAGDAVRRITLDQLQSSGRWFVDLDELVADPAPITKNTTEATPDVFHWDQATRQGILDKLPSTPKYAEDPGPDLIDRIIRSGGKAPSAGNMQPWKFVWHKKRLLLLHDHVRSGSVFDPDHRIAHIALGACVENVVLEAHGSGFEVEVNTSDVPGPVVATFVFHRNKELATEVHTMDHLREQIDARCTNRKIAAPLPLPSAIRDRIGTAARSIPQVNATFFSDPALLAEIAALCGAAERLRVLNPIGHHEFFHKELRWTPDEASSAKDGLDIATLEIGMKDIAGLRVASDPRARELLAAWKGGRNLEDLSRRAVQNSSAVLLLSTEGDDVAVRLAAGRAMERAWLTANGSGWSVHPVSAPLFLTHVLQYDLPAFSETEKQELRSLKARMERMLDLAAGEHPIFLMRLFKSENTITRSLRLSPDQLMV